MAGKKLSQAGKSQVTLKLSVPNCKKEIVKNLNLKLNYCKKVFLFALNFFPWEFLLMKKLEIQKTKTTQFTTFKTDMYNKRGLSFIKFQLQNSQGRKLSAF